MHIKITKKFGHFERWLKHPEYKNLAELPDAPASLNPENPESIKLIEELYDELLPNFSSKQFNVGCDETMQLGKGGSSNAVAKIGKGKVYLNFLKKINEQTQKYGKIMQFWGILFLNIPNLSASCRIMLSLSSGATVLQRLMRNALKNQIYKKQ